MMKALTLLALAAISTGAAHSAPAASTADDEAAIRKALVDGCAGFVAKSLDGAMAPYSPSLYTFDLAPPQHGTYAELREANRKLIDAIASTPTCTYRDMYIKVYGDNAYARYILPYSVTLKSGQKIDIEGRGTDIFEKVDGKWLIVHEHFSVPVDPVTGQAELKPKK